MKSETPREAANRIAYKYLDRTFGSAKLSADIEAALDAERERAAKIAETYEGHGDWCSSAAGDCQSLTVKAIAAAIRGSKQ